MPDIVLRTPADYLAQPRRVRRAISRDLARSAPIAPRPASYGNPSKPAARAERRAHSAERGRISAMVHGGTRMQVRPASTKSGQARINHKRAQRAAFWDAWAALHATT